MTIVETTRPVTGGVDTHADVHVAAVGRREWRRVGRGVVRDDTGGFRELHDWLTGFGPVGRVGVEGTGAYGAGLARSLRGRGVMVIEVDRPNRQERRRNGKSDELDAIDAARAALSGRAAGIAKSADGDVEAIRALLVVRRSGRNVRIKYLNQIRHLGFTAPDRAAGTAAGRAPCPSGCHCGRVATHCGERHRRVRDETGDRDVGTASAHARSGERATRPTNSRPSCGAPRRACWTSTASGSTPPRSCSSPRVTTHIGSRAKPRSRISVASHRCKRLQERSIRHRLDPGGNRQANHALWRIVFTRMSGDERTRKYVARRHARRSFHPRDHADLEALRRPRGLPAPHARLTDLERRA